MRGATEYARMFRSGQHGKLYFVSDSHARGETFHIWVLPSAEPINSMPWLCEDAIEVYGILGGQPGWTEYYGWLYRGEWEQDFADIVARRKDEIARHADERLMREAERERIAKERKQELLDRY